MDEIWTPDEEASRLHARFDALKMMAGIGQAKFARDHDIPGGPSMVSQHIKGRRPLNLEAATAYARGFRCPLVEISPRLANDIKQAAGEMLTNPIKQSAATDLEGVLQALSGYLGGLSEKRRVSVAGLLTDLVHSPDDRQILDSLKTLLDSKAFVQPQSRKA